MKLKFVSATQGIWKESESADVWSIVIPYLKLSVNLYLDLNIIQEKLDVLVNNAGCMVNTRELTKETNKYLLKQKQLLVSIKRKLI